MRCCIARRWSRCSIVSKKKEIVNYVPLVAPSPDVLMRSTNFWFIHSLEKRPLLATAAITINQHLNTILFAFSFLAAFSIYYSLAITNSQSFPSTNVLSLSRSHTLQRIYCTVFASFAFIFAVTLLLFSSYLIVLSLKQTYISKTL